MSKSSQDREVVARKRAAHHRPLRGEQNTPHELHQQRREGAYTVEGLPCFGPDGVTDGAVEAAVDVPETDPDPAQLTVTQSQSSSSAARRRLAEGCTSLMYACQRGDIVQVLAQMREKF
ncbi:GD21334 [Drosophila simulans]|uniref:GD21334 n=1 Tax=Drosophila simulans TaxID=7240 RepID=B4QXG4_DROSI|nr:GD21334 [Drosophila simulans]